MPMTGGVNLQMCKPTCSTTSSIARIVQLCPKPPTSFTHENAFHSATCGYFTKQQENRSVQTFEARSSDPHGTTSNAVQPTVPTETSRFNSSNPQLRCSTLKLFWSFPVLAEPPADDIAVELIRGPFLRTSRHFDPPALRERSQPRNINTCRNDISTQPELLRNLSLVLAAESPFPQLAAKRGSV